MLRNEVFANNLPFETEEESDANALVTAFRNKEVTDDEFEKLLDSADKNGDEFHLFSRIIRNFVQ